MTTNAIFGSKFDLLSSIANPTRSNFCGKCGVDFYSHLPHIAAKGVRSLSNAISTVFCFVSKTQVGRTCTAAIVSTGAFVKNTHSLWNRAMKKNVTNGVCRSDLSLCASHDASVYHSVSTMDTSRPKPASGCFINANLRHESVVNGIGKFLRAKVNRVNVRLHVIKFVLVMGPALGVPTREGNFIMPLAGLNAT